MPSGFPIRTGAPAVSDEWLERFGDVGSTLVADGAGGRGVFTRLRAIDPATRLIGTALTVHAQPRDNLILYKAAEIARAGDVLVVRTGGGRDCALIGDILAEVLQRAGFAGLVTDALIRDADGIQRLGWPVFCAGTHVAGPGKVGGHGIGFPVVVAGVMVRAGDLIVGDADGVVAASPGDFEAIWAGVEKKRTSEAASRQAIAEGLRIPPANASTLAETPYRHLE